MNKSPQRNTDLLSISVQEHVNEYDQNSELFNKIETLEQTINHLKSQNQSLKQTISKELSQKLKLKEQVFTLKNEVTKLNVQVGI